MIKKLWESKEPQVKLTFNAKGKSGKLCELVGEVSPEEMVSVGSLVVARKELEPSRVCSEGYCKTDAAKLLDKGLDCERSSYVLTEDWDRPKTG